MRTSTPKLLLLLTIIIGISSCQKEVSLQNSNNSGSSGGAGGTGGSGGTNSTSNIEGDYDFVGMTAHTQSTVTVNEAGIEAKTVTTSDYATKDNTGTATFTSTDFTFTNLSYTIDTTMSFQLYQDNQLIDSETLPFTESAPPTTSTNPYVRVSSDSLTMTGPLGVASDPTGTPPTGATGVKLAWSGDTLLLKINGSFNQSITQNGVTGIIVGAVNGVVKLKKH